MTFVQDNYTQSPGFQFHICSVNLMLTSFLTFNGYICDLAGPQTVAHMIGWSVIKADDKTHVNPYMTQHQHRHTINTLTYL